MNKVNKFIAFVFIFFAVMVAFLGYFLPSKYFVYNTEINFLEDKVRDPYNPEVSVRNLKKLAEILPKKELINDKFEISPDRYKEFKQDPFSE